MKTLRRLALLAALLLPFAGNAQETRQIVVPIEEAAKIAIQAGDLDAAAQLLGEALRVNPSSTEALFLMAEVERRRGNLTSAVEYYRKILRDRPDLARVRLDLARALFELREDEQAEYHFRLAIAIPDVPETVAANVNAFLAAIKRRRLYSFTLDFGVSPDSNVTGGPSANEVVLQLGDFGALPVQLSEDARKKSGLGFVVSAYGEYLAPLSDTEDHRWRVGGNFFRSEYQGGTIDDMTVRLFTGPQLRYPRGDISLLGVVSKRWFGNDEYNTGYGARLEGGYVLHPRLRVDASLEGLRLDYETSTFLEGFSVTGTTYTTWGIDQQSFLRFIAGAGTEQTELKGFTNTSVRLGVGFLRNFPFGITGYIQPEIYLVDYQEPIPLFSADARYDRVLNVLFSVYKRDWEIFGFSPTLNYTYTRDDSNIEFFTFTRHRFNIGFTREF